MVGTVKFWTSAGWGYLKDKDSDNEYFTCWKYTFDKVKEGDKVLFDLDENEKGILAVNVRRIKML
jgi:cold shock protein